MIRQTDSLLLTIQGPTVTLTDKKRDVAWVLDTGSVQYGGPVGKGDFPEDKVLRPLSYESTMEKGDRLIQRYKAGETSVAMEYCLLEDVLEVKLLPVGDPSVGCVTLPGAFHPQKGQDKLLLPIMQGMLWDGRGEP
jgi:hypothetical protein